MTMVNKCIQDSENFKFPWIEKNYKSKNTFTENQKATVGNVQGKNSKRPM